MDINWYYTEGELTLKVDGDEHKFSLEELLAGSSVFKERRKKVLKKEVLLRKKDRQKRKNLLPRSKRLLSLNQQSHFRL